jgi:hypothetical protein
LGCTAFGRNAADLPLGSAPNGVQINGFSGTNIPNVDWLISPSFDLTSTMYPLLSFWSRTAFNGEPLQLKVSTDYTGGDPANATWVDLNGKFPAKLLTHGHYQRISTFLHSNNPMCILHLYIIQVMMMVQDGHWMISYCKIP